MVSSRLRTTIVFFALCGLMATGAFAGNLTSASTNFAWEIAKSTTTFTVANQTYTLGVARLASQAFVITFTLDKGSFTAVNTTLATSYSTVAPADVSITYRSGGAGSTFISFDVNVNNNIALGGTFTLSGITYKFAGTQAVGYTVNLTASVSDIMGAFDAAVTPNSLTRSIAVLAAAASYSTTAGGEPGAVIDTARPAIVPLTAFVNANGDTDYKANATLNLVNSTAGVMDNSAPPVVYTLGATDVVTMTITGDFTNLTSVFLDLDGNGVAAAAETFTVSGTTATLTIPGTSFTGAKNVYFTKATTTTLAPRSFGISASIAPASGNDASRALATGVASNWFVWTQNGTTLLAPYVNYSTSNSTKFRFTNSGAAPVTIQYVVTLDQATATATTNTSLPTLTVPANGSLQVTFTDAPATNTGEVGPLVTITGGVMPIRAKVGFTALGTSTNLAGAVLIWNVNSSGGITTTYLMPQTPQWP